MLVVFTQYIAIDKCKAICTTRYKQVNINDRTATYHNSFSRDGYVSKVFFLVLFVEYLDNN